jgi:AhpD family alkylhydroperoxidase
MTTSTRVPPAEIDGLYGALVTRMSRRTFGKVPDGLGVLWHHRKVLNFSFGLGRKAAKWHECDEQLKTFASMAAAASIGCGFCLDLGYYAAHTKGLDLDKAREVPRWRESDAFTPLERDVLEYAEAVTATPPTVTDELSARLLDALGPAGLVELTATIALENLYSRTNNPLGITSAQFADSCGLPPLAQPSRVASRA